MATSESWQVFINFRGADLRTNFISHLEKDLTLAGIKYFIDTKEIPSEDLTVLLDRIKQSEIALSIFTINYAESKWCLDELVEIMEQVEKKKLRIIPVFFNVKPEEVKEQKGEFGLKLYGEGRGKRPNIRKWENALQSVPSKIGLQLKNYSNERELVDKIVDSIKRVLELISPVSRGGEDLIGVSTTVSFNGNIISSRDIEQPVVHYGVAQRLKQLEEKLEFDNEETRFIGVVGMPGIGKTTLAKMLYEKWQHKFERSMFFPDVRKMTKKYGFDWLQKSLMQELLKDIHPDDIEYTENAHEFWMDDLLEREVFVVLDDVCFKKQIESCFGDCSWIKKGSKIVITSNDESLLRELVHDTYVMPRLDGRDSLLWFNNHAFGVDDAKGNFVKLSRHFLDYAKGNPLVLKAFGEELRGNDEACWEQSIGKLTQRSNKMIKDVLEITYKGLTRKHKDAFLDVACFFNSENASNVRWLVDSCDEVRDLTNKFLVSISGGRVEMHNMLCTFAKELASQALAENTGVQWRLWNYEDINDVLKNKMGMKNVRGVFLDMSKVTEKMSFDNMFSSMCNLLYLRIYNSVFLQEGKSDFQSGILKELQLPLDKVRYLHWFKFPWEKLPSDFNAMKLVTLELPSSLIKKLWEGVKDTPKLKLVDLSYSRKLSDLSGLSSAHNLERLNLEGCKRLVKLPQEMKNMKSLNFLNMRGCERLRFLPAMKLSSLKILILSDCSKLQEFEVISENMEALYLDGTALKVLPSSIGKLKRLATLSMKGCTELKSLPECLGKQKALEELILSGCSKLESVPKNMRYLRILLLDGTRIKEMPKIYSVQRLCLSGNNAMIRLQGNIGQLDHLKWLDLKNCENLRYLPTLPPNLEFFDAHGCERLETVANPLSFCMMTEQIRSSFFFTNCNNLEQDSRDVISSYAQWKCQRLAVACYDRGILSGAFFNLCYPGFEVPMWFHHQAVGSVLEPRLEPHWCNNRLSGIALCAVVSFHDNQKPIDTFSVKCKLQIENKDGSRTSLDCNVGGLTEPGRIESDHVFIGYASCSHLTKRLANHSSNSIPTKAFLEFYVTNVGICEVVSCGVSFVYAEPQNVPVEASHYRSSSKMGGGLVEDFFAYIITAFLFVVIFAPQYYLRFLNFCGPVLVFVLFFLALALIVEWMDRKQKQQIASQASVTT